MENLHIERTPGKSQHNQLATPDVFTGIPSHALLVEKISAAMDRAARDGSLTGVVAIGIDEFSFLSRSYGHEVGEAMLRGIAARIRDAVRASDTVVQMGDEEFLLLATEIDSLQGMESALIRVQCAVQQPMSCEGISLSPTISCGVAVFPFHGATGTALLESAGHALDQARRKEKSCYVFAERSAPVPGRPMVG